MRIALVSLLFCLAIPARAQEADTARSYALESIIVTADRSESMLSRSTGAVSVLTAGELRRLPGVARLGDALRHMPGFAMLNLDGQGFDPQATVRGFYGGGETEYVLVLLDGHPVNNMEMGLVNWSQIPLSAIESIEVVRGGASSLYGDAAVGGVLNVVTNRQAEKAAAQLSLSAGSFGTYLGEASAHATVRDRPFSAFASLLQTEGFREHAARKAGSMGASLGVLEGETYRVTLSGLGHWRQYDIPGPLTRDEAGMSRTQMSPFFRFDNVDERTMLLTLDGRGTLSESSVLRVSASSEWRSSDIVRTLPLAAAFADTKGREVSTTRFFVSAQLAMQGLAIDTDRLTFGAEGRFGALDNVYYNMLTGSAAEYAAYAGDWGEVSTSGQGDRQTMAGYAQYRLDPLPRLRITLGGRYDTINDSYTAAEGQKVSASHTAFSPKVGVNLAFIRSARHVGHVYANYLGIFKAATLDQLYDQRILPVPFPPYGITISNSELKPQRGTSYEMGLYHRAVMSSILAGELTLSVYQVDMTDELDFSFETFSYANIAASRHSGLESGLRLYIGDRATAHTNYTLQNVTYEEGANKGNFVKGIPRDYLNLGISASLTRDVAVGVVLHSTARIYLDDANTMPLDDYVTLDATLSYRWHPARSVIKLESLNLLNASYSSTGFPDPDSESGSGVVFLYPAAGRSVRLGVTVTL